MQHDEDAGEDREEAVHLLDREARPGEARARGHQHAEDTEEESSRYATIPAERAKYQTPGLMPRAARATRCRQRVVERRPAPSWLDEAPGEAAAVEPRRPAGPEEERSLRGDVGGEAACGGDGDVAPRRVGRAAGARVDQMVLRPPPPASVRLATLLVASPPPSSVEFRRRAARRRRARRRDIAAGGDPAAPDQRERVVDGLALDDAVQVERAPARCAGGTPPRRESECHGGTAAGTTAPPSEGRRGEVAVVAGGDQMRHRRPAVTRPPVARAASSARESIDANSSETSVKPQGRGVDAVELGGRLKAAEAASRSSNSARTLVDAARRTAAARRSPWSGSRSRPTPLDLRAALPDGPDRARAAAEEEAVRGRSRRGRRRSWHGRGSTWCVPGCAARAAAAKAASAAAARRRSRSGRTGRCGGRLRSREGCFMPPASPAGLRNPKRPVEIR